MATAPDPFSLRRQYPAVKKFGYTKTSEATPDYNCIAWAANDTTTVWWPCEASGCHWPKGAPYEESLTSFMQAFATLGYVPCSDGTQEAGFEKIAIYANKQGVQHAARQLADGAWTSKPGSNMDISHTLEALESSNKFGVSIYGKVVQFMRRERTESRG